jgi:hypothetical protein
MTNTLAYFNNRLLALERLNYARKNLVVQTRQLIMPARRVETIGTKNTFEIEKM